MNIREIHFEEGEKYVIVNGVLTDRNRNRWRISHFHSRKNAIEAAESCDWGDSSYDNYNCMNVKNSLYINNCHQIAWIEGCTNLDSISYSSGLTDCHSIVIGRYLVDCRTLRGLREISNLKRAEDLKQEDILYAKHGYYSVTITPTTTKGGCTIMTNEDWLGGVEVDSFLEYDTDSEDPEELDTNKRQLHYLKTVTRPLIKIHQKIMKTKNKFE